MATDAWCQQEDDRWKKMRASHSDLDHTAELELRLKAQSSGELLAQAGRALGEFLVRAAPPGEGVEWRTLEVQSTDREALLVDWLNELLYVADVEHLVPVEFESVEATDTVVHARARCAPVTEAPAFVKAATREGIHLRDTGHGLEAEVNLDI